MYSCSAQVLSGFHKRGIACLAFSASGALLATVGLDDDHSVAVYSVAGVTRQHYSTPSSCTNCIVMIMLIGYLPVHNHMLLLLFCEGRYLSAKVPVYSIV
jgi:hypothetical protein